MTVLFELAGWGNSVRVLALDSPYPQAADLAQRAWRTVHIEVVAVPFAGTIATICTPAELAAWADAAVPADGSTAVLGGGRGAEVTLTREDTVVEVTVTPSGDDPYPRVTFLIGL